MQPFRVGVEQVGDKLVAIDWFLADCSNDSVVRLVAACPTNRQVPVVLLNCSCRTPPTRRFREVGAGCSAPALALLKYAYPAKIAIDARICLALCSREPEILGQYPHVAVEHRLRRLPVSLVSSPATRWRSTASAGKSTGGLPAAGRCPSCGRQPLSATGNQAALLARMEIIRGQPHNPAT